MANKINWTPIRIPLGKIRVYEQNPRFSTKKQAQRIIQSEKKFNQVLPFIVSPYDKDGYVDLIDGHQRYYAWSFEYAQSHLVSAIQSDRVLTEQEHKELIIVMHATAQGSWDWEKLSNWDVSELQQYGFDNDILDGWNMDAMNLREMLTAFEHENIPTPMEITLQEYNTQQQQRKSKVKCPNCGHEFNK